MIKNAGGEVHTMDIQKLSEKTGCDLSAALKRMGGMEALYMRLLGKFLEDKSFEGLSEAVRDKEYENIEKTAHTLKGVAANMGFDTLKDSADAIVQAVRAGRTEAVVELYETCREQYEKIFGAVKEEIA